MGSTSMVFTTNVKEETQLGPTVVYFALVNSRYVIPDIIIVIHPSSFFTSKKLYQCTHYLYIILCT